LVVARPALGRAILAPRSEFIPVEDAAAFFEADEPATAV
jgi:hypothetical protein